MIEELFAAFEESGANAGAEELAEILWLAARVDGGSDRTPGCPQDREDGPSAPLPHAPEPSSSPSAVGDTGTAEQFYSAADMTDAATSAVRAVDLVRIRRAASLRDPLGVMRALRPLGRPAIGRGDLVQSELDEELTVRSTIEQRLPMPVFRPCRGRWLNLALVIDTHHSMLLWHDLVTELRRVFVQTGIFRDVRTWHLSGTGPQETPRVARAGGEPRSVHEVADPSGHQLVLVVTDTVAGGWSTSSVQDVLRHWAAHNPVALLNVLPRRLWDRGAVRPQPHLVRAPRPAAPNASWRLGHAVGSRRQRHRAALAQSIAVPVVEASPDAISALARLVGDGGLWSRLPCLPLPRTPDTEPEPRFATPGPPREGPAVADEILRRFRADASPLAQALAGYLSAVPLNLPVMNLVRQIMLPASDPGHLAEVALGGLFEPWEHEARAGRTDLERMPFRFRTGIREALLGSQRRDEVTAIQELVRREMGAFVTERDPGPAGDFLAARGTSGGNGSRTMDQDALPFADRTSTPNPVGLPVREFLPPDEAYPPIGPGDVDAGLYGAVDQAVDGTSRLVVVIGERATGKTSAAMRALHRVPANWRVWSPSSSLTLTQGAPRVGPRTVVVLDDLETYASLPGFTVEGFARVVSELLESDRRAPVLVLATMAPETWRNFGGTGAADSAGQYEGWRRLVAQADVVSLSGAGGEFPVPRGEPSDARIVVIADISAPVQGGSLIRHLGTGLLLSPRVILTAAHNLTRHALKGGIKASSRRGTRAPVGWADCSVVWKHDTLDAALLLTSEGLVASETDGFFSIPQWAQLTDGAMLGSCHFTSLMARSSEPHASGRVPGTLLAASPRPGVAYTFEPSAPVPPSTGIALSGAPVLCDGFLLGFSLTEDHAQHTRMSVLGVNTLFNDKGFSNACHRYLGHVPRVVSLPTTAARPDGDQRDIGSHGRRTPRVFISYARDAAVVEQVAQLHQLLTRQGFEARLERTPSHLPRNWSAWLNNELRLADAVLMIMPFGSEHRTEGAEADDDDVRDSEAAQLFRIALRQSDDETRTRPIIPVVLPGGTDDDRPVSFGLLNPVVVKSLSLLGIAPLLARLPEARPGPRGTVDHPVEAEKQYELGVAVDLRITARTLRTEAEALRLVRALVMDILSPDETHTEAPVGDWGRVDLLVGKQLDRTALAHLPHRLLELEVALTPPDDSQDRRADDHAVEPLRGRGVDIAMTVVPWDGKTDSPRMRAAVEAGEMLTADAVRQKLRRSVNPMNVVLSNTLHEQFTARNGPWAQEQFDVARIPSTGPALKVWIRHEAHHPPAGVAALIRKVEDLQTFERKMRSRVKAYADSLQRRLETLDGLGPDGTLHTELESFKHEAEIRLLSYLGSQRSILSEPSLPVGRPPLDPKAEDLRRFHQEYRDRLLVLIEDMRQRVQHRHDTPLLDLMPFAAPPHEPYPTPLHRSLAELNEFVAQLADLTVKPPRQDPSPNRSPQDVTEGRS
ncbi:SAV_2336 N-terminal domain-related protein [Streptomyces sp. NPDC048278]|uniref:SAV_2336 N-terminal domain-related protein n=1 Tax=Streptomyces sp. NPDC048278 TaxID=3155809 RepID=UPI003439B5FF